MPDPIRLLLSALLIAVVLVLARLMARVTPRLAIVFAVVGGSLGLGALIVVEWALPSHPVLPPPSGPHDVRRHTVTMGDYDGLRYDPATASTALPRADYMPDPAVWASVLQVPPFLLRHLRRVATHTSPEAATLHVDEPWIVYLHGTLSVPEDQTVLLTELASHGHVVLAPRLGLNAQALGLRDIQTEAQMVDALARLEEDFVPTTAASLTAAVAPLLPMDQGVVMIGHSLGGGLAGAVANRLVASGHPVLGWVNLDGHVMEPIRPEIPQLHLSQGVLFAPDRPPSPITQDYTERINNAIRAASAPTTWLRFPNAGHATFTDAPYLMRPLGPLAQLIGDDPDLPAAIHQVVMAFVRDPGRPPTIPAAAHAVLTTAGR
ncbi:MAG: alpha/beta fold hydrolase [Myxococcota bacterium]